MKDGKAIQPGDLEAPVCDAVQKQGLDVDTGTQRTYIYAPHKASELSSYQQSVQTEKTSCEDENDKLRTTTNNPEIILFYRRRMRFTQVSRSLSDFFIGNLRIVASDTCNLCTSYCYFRLIRVVI